MFFERDFLSFRIIEVWDLRQKNVRMMNRGRDYSAISFRTRSDAILKPDGAEYVMKEGTVTFVPAHLDYLRVASVDEMIVVDFENEQEDFPAIECFQPKDPDRLARLFQGVLSSWKEQEPGYRLRCASLLYEILAECHVENQKTALPSSRIRPSLDYMQRAYRRHDLTVSEIAARSFMSEVYFRRLFKEEYDTSPIKYLVKLRIDAAADMIEKGYLSLKEVADLSGFSDYKYFSVEFKRLRGVSPSEYARSPSPRAEGVPSQSDFVRR